LDAQRWDHRGLEGGLVRSVASGRCLTAAAEGAAPGLRECNSSEPGQHWSLWRTRHLADPQTEYWKELEAWTRVQNSLYCFLVAVPRTEEEELLRFQAAEHKGAFACDECAVISSQPLDLGGFGTTLLDEGSEMRVLRGGRFNTSLNTELFMQVWSKVAEVGRFRFFDWTVKADPDAVFFPERLMDVLRNQPDMEGAQDTGGMYFQNCEGALHGALEVLSRTAVEAFTRGRGGCRWHNQEDWYLSDCLDTVGSRPRFVARLLADTSCPGFHPGDCAKEAAAFHPFKSTAAFLQCWDSASSSGRWSA